MDFELVYGNIHEQFDSPDPDLFGALIQYPGTFGDIHDLENLIEKWHESETMVAVASDPLSLVLLKPPGELGADVVVGSTQRFGVPMGYGGPHAAFLATRDTLKRSLPGRVIRQLGRARMRRCSCEAMWSPCSCKESSPCASKPYGAALPRSTSTRI